MDKTEINFGGTGPYKNVTPRSYKITCDGETEILTTTDPYMIAQAKSLRRNRLDWEKVLSDEEVIEALGAFDGKSHCLSTIFESCPEIAKAWDSKLQATKALKPQLNLCDQLPRLPF